MDWQMPQLMSCIILYMFLGRSVLALEAANPYSALPTSAPSAVSLDDASTSLTESRMTSFYEVPGRSPAAAATAAASTSANLTVSVLSQAAAAASSQALAEAPSSTDDGSEVNIFTQIIIAISVIPVQLVIVTIVLGIHRLVHRRPPRHLQFRVESASPTQESPPYLQPKAELEDDRARRHELHGEHAVRELDREGEIFQIADETDSIVLPLHGTRMISEMPEPHDLGSEMPHQTRTELMGGEIAQELECPSQGREDSVEVQNLQGLEYPICAGSESVVSESVQELASPVQAREQPIGMGKAPDRAAPGHVSLTDTTHSNPSQNHFMVDAAANSGNQYFGGD